LFQAQPLEVTVRAREQFIIKNQFILFYFFINMAVLLVQLFKILAICSMCCFFFSAALTHPSLSLLSSKFERAFFDLVEEITLPY